MLGGDPLFVIRGQVSGRCIHHAALVRAPLCAILPVTIAVIESSLGALLVTLARSLLLSGAFNGGAGRAVATATVVPAAHHEAGTTKRTLALDTDLEHRETNSEKLAAARADAILRAPSLRIFRRMLLQQPEGSEL